MLVSAVSSLIPYSKPAPFSKIMQQALIRVLVAERPFYMILNSAQSQVSSCSCADFSFVSQTSDTMTVRKAKGNRWPHRHMKGTEDQRTITSWSIICTLTFGFSLVFYLGHHHHHLCLLLAARFAHDLMSRLESHY